MLKFNWKHLQFWRDPMMMGWRPNERDDRDWDYGDIAYAKNLDSKIDLSVHLPKVLYQGAAPSCVGHGIAHQIWIEERIGGLRGTAPSRGYIWALARKQHQHELRMTGTHPRLAYKGVRLLGCPPESKWPYSTNKTKACTMPSDRARRWGMSRKGLRYYTIKANRSDQIRQALNEGHPVCIGTQVWDAMRKATPNQILHRPFANEPMLGGHYMCIVGYEKDHFIVLNSWKRRERLLFHENVIEWSKTGDLTVATGWV